MSTSNGFQLFTEGGYPLDEAMSAMQKCIRRGMEKEALYWAIELNSKFPKLTWKRLIVICCEDIGGANPDLIGTVCSLAGQVEIIRKESKEHDYDLCILGHAVLQMARSPKSREADDAVNEVLRERRVGKFRPEVPDFALDKHTARGRAKKRGIQYFWQEGAKLVNEAYPSTKYVGWNSEDGDGYHNADGKNASFIRPTLKNGQVALFGDDKIVEV